MNIPQKYQTLILSVLTALLALFLTACAKTLPMQQHKVLVREAASGNPVAGANVTAEIALRYTVNATTDSDGIATLSFDPHQLELHNWTKVNVETDDYPTKSVLVQLRESGPPTEIDLGKGKAAAKKENATDNAEQSESPASDESSPKEQPQTEPAVEATESTSTDKPRPLANVPAAERDNYYDSRPEMTIDPAKVYRATIKTSKGDIVLTLDATASPEHVNNFVFLSNQGFYDGLTFHRVEPGFVIQGGDPQGSGQGGPGYTVPGEFSLKHIEGALAMARLPDTANPNRESSGSQFYITLAPTPFLDNEYSVFGAVESGMDVVTSIKKGDTIDRIEIDP